MNAATQPARFVLPLENTFEVVNAIYRNAKASGVVTMAVLDGWYNGAMEFATGDTDLSGSRFSAEQGARSAQFWGTDGRVPFAVMAAARAFRAGARSAA